MKQLIQLGVLSSFLASSAALALNNPIQGFYAGIMAGISHGPSNNSVIFEEDRTLFTGIVNYSSVGGGGGAMLGYKLSHFRLEGEILYNRFSTGPLQVNPGGCTLESPNVLTPSGFCPPGIFDRFQEKALGYSGSSAVTYGIGNLYYDFFTPNSNTNVVPYIGLGIGMAQIRNFSDFVNTNTSFSHGFNDTFTTQVAQGILGLSYFMDDFTWAGMDLRYITTKSLPEMDNQRYGLISLNFTINFAFDKGAIDC
ncbi:hypothetical protein TUM19329_12280 [Legionella antarctica]|uniref:Outer membrane protein beta-barrel domain-containing protein n=1 Tax=Legionella antarctica TaxID=2708020 RepID=A0A6F8T3X5_9GAMM|nr:outer membrane beta-barrel protein [Legionella antarctica]BCA94867.1 hypothetical protein TUM19329_12280 [Legionella antarctica]